MPPTPDLPIPAAPTLPLFDTNHVELLPLKEVIIKYFIDPWDTYKQQDVTNKVNLCLSCYITEQLTTNATESAQMAVDEEPTVDRSQLQDLIKAQTMKETKSLQKKIIVLE
eukprot:11849140-Ditylum_brightwellii.AAC.1